MRWNFNPLRRLGARFRRQHSLWLTRAMSQPADRYPRIPTRRVDRGGYEAMLRRPGGAERAALWWDVALDRVD